jgi:hypothetical protein
MRKSLATSILGLLLITTPQAFGWGNQGHQTVGAVADRLIAGTHAAEKVRALLLPGESLESVSIWAECAKGYCGPLTPEMRAFVAANPKHNDYHFTDLPFELTSYQEGAVGTTDHDVVRVLRQCVAVLRGPTSPDVNPHGFTERQALLLMTHLVGDVHQPLHVGTADMDTHDRYTVPATQSAVDEASIFSTHGDNYLLKGSGALHAYWDTQAVKSAMTAAKVKTPAGFASYLIRRKAAVPPSTGDAAEWPTQWASETVKLSQRAHQGVEPHARETVRDRNGNPHLAWPVTVPGTYAVTAKTTARDQLWVAGSRLAVLLQAIWP